MMPWRKTKLLASYETWRQYEREKQTLVLGKPGLHGSSGNLSQTGSSVGGAPSAAVNGGPRPVGNGHRGRRRLSSSDSSTGVTLEQDISGRRGSWTSDHAEGSSAESIEFTDVSAIIRGPGAQKCVRVRIDRASSSKDLAKAVAEASQRSREEDSSSDGNSDRLVSPSPHLYLDTGAAKHPLSPLKQQRQSPARETNPQLRFPEAAAPAPAASLGPSTSGRGSASMPDMANGASHAEQEEEGAPGGARVVSADGMVEYATLELRVHPPTVKVDNELDDAATVVIVESANRPGTLVEVVQNLTELGLDVRGAQISSDGGWFVDVFYVTDLDGRKVRHERTLSRIKDVLDLDFDVWPAAARDETSDAGGEEQARRGRPGVHVVELIAKDKPCLLSAISETVTQCRLNVYSTLLWTYRGHVAAILTLGRSEGSPPSKSDASLSQIKRAIEQVLAQAAHAGAEVGAAPSSSSFSGLGVPSMVKVCSRSDTLYLEKRFYRLKMYLMNMIDLACLQRRKNKGATGPDAPPAAQNGAAAVPSVRLSMRPDSRTGYTILNVTCQDRPQLLFDTVCTLSDLDIDVYHGTVDTEGALAKLEFFVRRQGAVRQSPARSQGGAGGQGGASRRLSFLPDAAAGEGAAQGSSPARRDQGLAGGSPDAARDTGWTDEEVEVLNEVFEKALAAASPRGTRLQFYNADSMGFLSTVAQRLYSSGLNITYCTVRTDPIGGKGHLVFYVNGLDGAEAGQAEIEASCRLIGARCVGGKAGARQAKADSPRGDDKRIGGGGEEEMLANWDRMWIGAR